MNGNEMAFPKMGNRKLVQIDEKNAENANVTYRNSCRKKNTFKRLRDFRTFFISCFACSSERITNARCNVKQATLNRLF